MILEDIKLTGDARLMLPSLPLVRDCYTNALALKQIKQLVFSTSDKEWLNAATETVKNKMVSNTQELIKEAEQEIVKAKELLKEKFPVEYRKEYWKVIKKNPIKAFIGWLLTLK